MGRLAKKQSRRGHKESEWLCPIGETERSTHDACATGKIIASPPLAEITGSRCRNQVLALQGQRPTSRCPKSIESCLSLVPSGDGSNAVLTFDFRGKCLNSAFRGCSETVLIPMADSEARGQHRGKAMSTRSGIFSSPCAPRTMARTNTTNAQIASLTASTRPSPPRR